MEKEEKKEEGEGKPKLTDEQKAAIAKKIMEECKGKEGDEASKCMEAVAFKIQVPKKIHEECRGKEGAEATKCINDVLLQLEVGRKSSLTRPQEAESPAAGG